MKCCFSFYLFLTIFFFQTEKISAQGNVAADSLKPKTHQLKVDFLAPITGNFTIGYETFLSNHLSFDFRVGIIGLGYHDYYNKLQGLFFKFEPNFYILPNNFPEIDNSRSHFQGTYFSPALILNAFSYNTGHNYNHVTSEAFTLNLGHQFVFNNILSLNIYGGAGYSFYQEHDGNPYRSENYFFSHLIVNEYLPFCLDGGIELGISFR